MPAGLRKPVQAVWKRIVPDLAARGVLSDLDGEALTVLCILRAEFEADPGSFSPPKLSQLRMLFCEFGLTPASRARVPVLEPAPPAPTLPAGVSSIDDVRARLERRIAEGGKE